MGSVHSSLNLTWLILQGEELIPSLKAFPLIVEIVSETRTFSLPFGSKPRVLVEELTRVYCQ